MQIDYDVHKYSVFSTTSIFKALKKISQNKKGIVFAVSSSGVLEGVLTDGDFRRWIVSGNNIDENTIVKEVINKDFVSKNINSPHEILRSVFDDSLSLLPLIDDRNKLKAIAVNQLSDIKIGDLVINKASPTFIIAEIGNNHNGDIQLAKRLVEKAVDAGADCAKFQMRTMTSLYNNLGDKVNVSEDLGGQYTLDLLSKFQLEHEQLLSIFDYCKSLGIIPLCTPWEVQSLAILEDYGMPAYKVASADLTNFDFLKQLSQTKKTLICSTGMSDEEEIINAVGVLKGCHAEYVLLHCNSTYPAPFKDINLNYLSRLSKIGDSLVGYSGHERGYAVVIGAVALGAKIIEKHFTLDRNMEGNDHKVSLLPHEFSKMVKGIRELEQALGEDKRRSVSQGEMMNREVLAKSLVINRDLDVGETITNVMIDVKSPGKGLQPNRKEELIGKKAVRKFSAGDYFFQSDLNQEVVANKDFKFSRPFGLPVRYHDFDSMIDRTNIDLVEFHLSYKDLDENPAEYLKEKYDFDLVVHAPELFANDHVLDLASFDNNYTEKSLSELQRVINLTDDLKNFFNNTKAPMIIVNAGGFSADTFIDKSLRQSLYSRLAKNLARLSTSGVEIILQTMPPFPWHFGGQRFHNLMMMPEDIELFCSKYGYRICLDTSHSQLTANYFDISFNDFLTSVGKYTAHIHLVDAKGVDEEGLQIGEGQIDFGMVSEQLKKLSPNSGFIPEIWQGHKNGGEGFLKALEKLEAWF